jgi:hypothetical protein
VHDRGPCNCKATHLKKSIQLIIIFILTNVIYIVRSYFDKYSALYLGLIGFWTLSLFDVL